MSSTRAGASTRPERADLAAMGMDELVAHLGANSSLPGPRGNLELADAFSATASREAVARALQILGRTEPAAMHAIVAEWVEHRDAFVRRTSRGLSRPTSPRID